MTNYDTPEENASGTTDDSTVEPTVVHERSGIHYTFNSVDELAVMFRALANFFGVQESCRSFRLKDESSTMMDVYERGWYELLDFDGYHWLSDAMNDSEHMVREYHSDVYDETSVSQEDATTNETTVLYEDSPVGDVIDVFTDHGLGERIPTSVFGHIDGSDSVLSFLDTMDVLQHNSDDETVMMEDSQKATEVMNVLV